MLTGTLVNTVTVICGSLIGLLLGNILPERLRDTVMKGLGLCTIFIGVTGMMGGENALITIISVALGAVIGELCDLDGRLNRFAGRLEEKFQKKDGGKVSLAEGFVTASLVFCVGAMTIVGALQGGLTGNHEMLFTKATLDFVSAMIFASSLGVGVLLAAVPVLVIEGGIACLANLMAPLLQSGNTISEMVVVGSVLIVGLGLNLIGVTKLKVMNYVPAIFLPILLCMFL